jgi:hypothetical protein
VTMGLLKTQIARRSVPLVPASLIEPLWVEFAALVGTEQQFRATTHGYFPMPESMPSL